MEKKEYIHIGLPVFNGERYLRESLDSLLNQTHEKFRLYIVDNLSTDGTQDIALTYAKRDSRIQYIRQTEWGSWPVNWSRTWAIASPGSEYFMWASDDDLWAPEYIETLLLPLIKFPRKVLSFSQVDMIDGKGITIGHLYRDSHPKGNTSLARIQSLLNSSSYSAIYGLFRTCAVTHQPAFPEVSFGADLWFLIQLASQGGFHFEKRVLFWKRKGGISQTGEDPCTVFDPKVAWNIGPEEWNILCRLRVPFTTKLWTFYQMKILAKIVFHEKSINWFLYPMFYLRLLAMNPYALGLRSRSRDAWKRLQTSWGSKHS